MISRREMVAAGVFGSIAATAAPAEAAPAEVAQQSDPGLRKAAEEAVTNLEEISRSLSFGQRGPGVASGFLAEIRSRFTIHLRAAGKFPEFMEIGVDPFYDVYDWHIRYNQPIQITRISDQRFAIQWMFTQLILRWEQDPRYLGTPFDRG